MAQITKLPPTCTAESLVECIRSVSVKTAQKALELSAAGEPDLDSRVHKMRVAIKRLRANWRLLMYAVPKDLRQAADQRLKDTSRLLGPARDETVLEQALQKFRDKPSKIAAANRSVRLDWSRIDGLLRCERDAWKDLEPVFQNNDPVGKGLRHTYREVRKRGRSADLRSSSDEERHRWRRWVKYLYYQLNTLRQCGLKDQKEFIACLDALGGALGREHDLVLLQQYVISRALPDAVVIVDKVENEKRNIREQTHILFSGRFSRKPRNFQRSIRNAMAG